ncbi:hypothetical protein [Sphingomonas sp. 8AM]|uniref:hypothetical protein n=1 Tax=Sphingomonas sp. 8AM TaxID=2653170 RepID=UPI0012F20470|nr:hypothetical protein [Sphingomonas sp. 8AM]VXC84001.1 hypothetical protein SPHINGO8AM_30178 [Sphingomonas sp. 8AM]
MVIGALLFRFGRTIRVPVTTMSEVARSACSGLSGGTSASALVAFWDWRLVEICRSAITEDADGLFAPSDPDRACADELATTAAPHKSNALQYIGTIPPFCFPGADIASQFVQLNMLYLVSAKLFIHYRLTVDRIGIDHDDAIGPFIHEAAAQPYVIQCITAALIPQPSRSCVHERVCTAIDPIPDVLNPKRVRVDTHYLSMMICPC